MIAFSLLSAIFETAGERQVTARHSGSTVAHLGVLCVCRGSAVLAVSPGALGGARSLQEAVARRARMAVSSARSRG
jgi:hypothetical protein